MSVDRSISWQIGMFVVLAATASAGTTTRVSIRSNGAQGDKASSGASISADGRYVAFASDAKDLVSGDTNDLSDVFVHDLQTGTTIRVSVGSAGEQGDGDSTAPRISADGRYVVFASGATNLVPSDGNGASDVFVRDLQADTIARVSVDSSGVEANGASFAPAISADGRFVAFQSDATNLVEGDTNDATDVFVRDLVAGTTVRVSLSSSAGEGDGASTAPAISGDGRYVAFQSDATNLVPGDVNQASDVFVYDLQQARIHQASLNSLGLEGNAASEEPSISTDGRWVAFASSATNLVHGDLNGHDDVFVRDLESGETTRASLTSSGAEGDGDSAWPAISADGRFVAFESLASNLVAGDGNDAKDVFLRDRWTAAISRISVDSSGAEANGDSYGAAITADARSAAFTSTATNLVAGDTNGCADVFVNDRGADSAFVAFCFGDGSAARCPCGNLGAAGHGCENSSTTGGAVLTVTGAASLAGDTVQLASSGEKPTALSIVLQGSALVAPANFGDGLRCAGGILKRLYVETASGGAVSAPQPGDASVSARSSALGDPISVGATRVYQVYYRDADSAFCPGPHGGTFNATQAIAIAWGT